MPNLTILPGEVNAIPEVVKEAAVATPPVTVISPEKILAEKAARYRAAMAAPDPAAAQAAIQGGKPVDKPKASVDDEPALTAPPKILAELGKLQAKVRELEPKGKDFDALKPDADLAKEAKRLWSGTHEDKIKAIALLSGKDGVDEIVNLVKTYYDLEQANPEQVASDEPPYVKALKDTVAKLNEELTAIKADKTKEKDEATKTATSDEIKRGNEFVKAFIVKNKEQFELCAKPENEKEAVEDVQDAVIAILDRDKIDIKTLTKEAAETVYLEALKNTEALYEETGKRMSKATAPQRDPFHAIRIRTKPDIKIKAEDLSNDPDVRFAQMKQRMNERAALGDFRRR